MKETRQEALDKAFERGKNYEMKNGGCPQCTLAAIFDVLGVENDAVFKSATALADGVGLTGDGHCGACLLYTSPSPRDRTRSRMPSSA